MRSKPRSILNLFTLNLGWLPLMPLAFGYLVFWFGSIEIQRAEQLELEGVVTTAVVTDKWQERERSSGEDRISRYVAFDFETSSAPWEGYNSVSRDYYVSVSVGDEVEMRYSRIDPTLTELEIGRNALAGQIFRGIGLALLAGGLGWMAYCLRQTVLLYRLRQNGAVVELPVSEVQRHGIRSKTPQSSLKWDMEFFGPQVSQRHPKESLDHIKPGTLIRIYVDPTKRLNPWWEGDLGPRVE